MAIMKIISRSMVKPAEPTWNGIMPLSELDQISVITHAAQLYFYDKPTQEDWLKTSPNNKLMDTLKDSLSRALVPFYPLAGRLGWIRRGRMALDCNALGAELVEVESTMKIADYGNFYSCSEKFQDLLVELDYCTRPLRDIPLLAVQVTRFACGGLCVGISMSHTAVDGRSSFYFVDQWARLARGEPIKVAPFLDRRVLLAQDQVQEDEFVDDINQGDYFSNMEKENRATPIFLVLTKDQVQRLQEDANGTSDDIEKGRPYSRFEAIAAHVWRCACKARELKNEDITSFSAFVDVRARMDPPLPSNYFGNAVVIPNISTSVGELVSKPLSYACSKIREFSTNVTSKFVTEYIENLKNEESLVKYQYMEDRGRVDGPSCGDHGVIAISWLNLATLSIDFGWGKEIYMGPCTIYDCDGNFYVSPNNSDDGSVLVGVFLHPKQKFQEYMMSIPF